MKYLFISFILLFVIENSYSQSVKVRNVHYRQIDEQIEIFYDLPVNIDSIQVKLVFRKKSAPKFRYYPRFIGGDIGIGIFSGKNKKIVWDIKKEPSSVFTGSDFYFDVKVRKWTEKKKER
ncbi:MAG TPA: hypothetical protein DCG75_11490 [Bacteroidales bacterium]|nr:hypothetical protein [Bacteroidales bacterium]